MGCAAKRPALYPNEKLRAVGPAVAERDIDACISFAKANGAQASRSGEVAANTAGGAVVGGAAGGAYGAVMGNAGRQAGAGAAAGATVGFFRGLFQSSDPDPVLRGMVDRCLREKGYDPVGWR